MTKRRVLHVIDHTGSGGAQVVVEYLVRALRDRFSFGVAVLGEHGAFSEAYASLGVPVYSYGRHRGRWNPFVVKGLVETIRDEEYEIVHSHLFKSNILATLAAQRTGCRTILHDHTGIYPHTLEHHFPNRLVRSAYLLAYRYALGHCDRGVVLTPAMYEACERFYSINSEMLAILPNAVDLDAFDSVSQGEEGVSTLRTSLGLSSETKVVVMVARLDPIKDWETFLGVAERVQQRTPQPCAFLVVGSGPEEHCLRNRATALGLDRLYFLGHRGDVPALLAEADLFLLTSLREAFPLVLLEAKAARCPIVATRTAGAEAIVTDGIDGLLANVGDVEGLAASVMRLLGDPQFARRLGARGRQVVEERYGLRPIAKRMAELYAGVLAA